MFDNDKVRHEWENVELDHTGFEDVIFERTTSSSFTHATFENCEFEGPITDVNFKGATFRNCTFLAGNDQLKARDSSFEGCKFIDCDIHLDADDCLLSGAEITRGTGHLVAYQAGMNGFSLRNTHDFNLELQEVVVADNVAITGNEKLSMWLSSSDISGAVIAANQIDDITIEGEASLANVQLLQNHGFTDDMTHDTIGFFVYQVNGWSNDVDLDVTNATFDNPAPIVLYDKELFHVVGYDSLNLTGEMTRPVHTTPIDYGPVDTRPIEVILDEAFGEAKEDGYEK